jgi:hypothetical protein
LRTATLTVPAAWAGELTVIEVDVELVTRAFVPAKVTLVDPERLLPEIVTCVPPAVEPVLTLRPVMLGGAS